MNNITMDDIDQNRPPPKRKCHVCGKEIDPSDTDIVYRGLTVSHKRCYSTSIYAAFGFK